MTDWLEQLQQFAKQPRCSVTITREVIELYCGFKPIDWYKIDLRRQNTLISVMVNSRDETEIQQLLDIIVWLMAGGTFPIPGFSIVREIEIDHGLV